MQYMPDIQQMPDIQHMPDIQQMPFSEKKRPTLLVYDTQIPDIQHMPAENKKRKKWPSYETEYILMADPNYRSYVEEYGYPRFNLSIGDMQA